MCSTAFIINVLMKEIGKLECPKKGGDMCLLQMGMDVKYSETEKKMKGGEKGIEQLVE